MLVSHNLQREPLNAFGEQDMRSIKSILLLGGVLVALIVGANSAWANNYPVPLHLPDWWKTPADLADGWTRTEYDSFRNDPSEPGDGDYTYNGFESDVPDEWNADQEEPPLFDQLIPSDDVPSPDGDGFGAHIADITGIHKIFGNAYSEDKIKKFFAEVVWFDASEIKDGTLILDCVLPSGASHEGGYTITTTSYQDPIGSPDTGWRVTYIDGTISPQPPYETFTLSFKYGDPWVDSAWVGTTCVPEPGTIGMIAAGALGVLGAAWRRFKR